VGTAEEAEVEAGRAAGWTGERLDGSSHIAAHFLGNGFSYYRDRRLTHLQHPRVETPPLAHVISCRAFVHKRSDDTDRTNHGVVLQFGKAAKICVSMA